jgi:hypothetical protein
MDFRVVDGVIELYAKVAVNVFAFVGEGKFSTKLFNDIDNLVLVFAPD